MFNIQKEFEKRFENIQIMRNRLKYKSGSTDYAMYLVKEIFGYHYTMQEMWSCIMDYANQDLPSCAADAYDKLIEKFNETNKSIVGEFLDSKLINEPEEWVGAIHYSGFVELIDSCANGYRHAREELEFSYLYYTLSDLCTLYWAATCASGISKLDSIKMITGYKIEPMPLNDYKVLTNGLGQLYISQYLEQHYTPLP